MKNIKNILLLLLCAGVFTSTGTGQIDLSAREALYFTGAKTDGIDLGKDPYVAKGGKMMLSTVVSNGCDHNAKNPITGKRETVCDYNFGFIAMRTGVATNSITTSGSISIDGGGSFSRTFVFAKSLTSQKVIISTKLALGKNLLTFKLDPQNTVPETNETNNTFTVTVFVNASTPKQGEN